MISGWPFSLKPIGDVVKVTQKGTNKKCFQNWPQKWGLKVVPYGLSLREKKNGKLGPQVMLL